MRDFRSNHSIRHMFSTLGAFVLAILLLESGGLENWANHLEPGPLRTVAAPAAYALNKTLGPLGAAVARDRTLDEAARLGWSDDAVRVAHVTAPATEQAAASQPQSGQLSAATAPQRASKSFVLAVGAPIVGSVPNDVSLAPLGPVEHGRPRVVVLTGDSMMAVGFGTGLMRRASGDKNLRFLRVFKSGTGLARPDVFNWMDQYPAMLGSEKPDVVIVAIGANDGQSFVEDGQVLKFGTEEWRKTYQSRVAEFLAMVENTGARVLWIGLPPMRADNFNQRIAVVNRIAYTVVSQDPKASWWSTSSFVGDASGSYREFAQMPNGTIVRLRQPDGIHFAEDGASAMTAVLMKWLDPPLQGAGGQRGLPPAKPAEAPSGGEPTQRRTTIAIAQPERPRH